MRLIRTVFARTGRSVPEWTVPPIIAPPRLAYCPRQGYGPLQACDASSVLLNVGTGTFRRLRVEL